jgi:predicted Ser/Thr protein kinase
MTNQQQCEACGGRLAADAPYGLCPACLFKRGLQSEPDATEGAGRQAAGVAPPAPAELAAHFPDLEILEMIGRGGMGIVYKARQKQLGRTVALKILSPAVAQDPAFAERFSREARALAMLNHPHIVAVYDFGRKDDLFYFLMEYVDGANLRQLLDGGRLAPREALAIVPQICDALQYAHDHGVVHRDIKPENLLLDKRGQVKIADFGLAKLAGREPHELTLTGTGQVMGTLHYMAPEQTEHPQQVDHRADIYSLGVVFYQMLTGELPLGRFAPPSCKVEIDVRLDDVVLRALEKEPELRYQHASEIKTRVESIATSAPQRRPRPEWPQPERSSAAAAELDKARREVRLPAVGLLVAGILNFLAVTVAGTAWGLVARYAAAKMPAQSPLTAAEAFAASWSEIAQGVLLLVLFAGLIASGLTMFGALRMMRLEGYRAAVTASILGMIVSPGNLVGLPIGIWALVVLSSRSVKAAFAANRPPVQPGESDASQPGRSEQPPLASVPGAKGPAVADVGLPTSPHARLSRVAVVGAVWAPFFLFVVVATFSVVTVRVEAGAEPPGPAWWQTALAVTLLPLGLTAPLGTTICGVVSLSQIRHSGGRLYGLGLAVFDLLLYPLLALNAVIGFFVFAAFRKVALMVGGEHTEIHLLLPLGVTFLTCAAVAAVTFWLVRRAASR